MERGGNFFKLVLVAALGLAGWYGYKKFFGPPTVREMAQNAIVVGDYRTAADYLEFALQQDPDNLTIHAELGECYYYLGQKAKAATHYRTAEPLFHGTSVSVSMRRHKERFEVLSQQGY